MLDGMLAASGHHFCTHSYSTSSERLARAQSLPDEAIQSFPFISSSALTQLRGKPNPNKLLIGERWFTGLHSSDKAGSCLKSRFKCTHLLKRRIRPCKDGHKLSPVVHPDFCGFCVWFVCFPFLLWPMHLCCVIIYGFPLSNTQVCCLG